MKQNTKILRMRKLSPETLERIKQWSEKRLICKSPHCGEKCVITLEKSCKEEKKDL